MKITLRLVGLRTNDSSVVHIKLQSADGMESRDQKKVFNYIRANSTVQGLECEMRGGGFITYGAAEQEITPDIVSDMRAVFQAALRQI